MYEVNWRVISTNGQRYDGRLPDMAEPVEINQLESALFKAVSDMDVDKLLVSLREKDGSGHIRHYAKRGDTWVVLYADNVLPWWFPLFFFGLFLSGFGLLLLFILMR